MFVNLRFRNKLNYQQKELSMEKTRRTFIKKSSQVALGIGLFGLSACGNNDSVVSNKKTMEDKVKETIKEVLFEVSLAQWSLHRMLKGGKLDNLDFASFTKKEFGISGIEYVNQFFKDKAKDMAYLGEMKKRASDNGVKSLLIMVDGEGGLGDPNDKARKTAVENHFKWVDAAQFLGCHSIRVNAFGEGSAEDVQKAAINGLGNLAEYGKQAGLNVIVENHGSYSSNGKWLSGIMSQINMPNCGTLPDFGNFCTKKSGPGFWDGDCLEEYDRYKGVEELMPFAKAVSAKSHDFNEAGDETNTDFMKMMQIVKNAGYKGFVGVEYEGSTLGEVEGIKATKALLDKVIAAL